MSLKKWTVKKAKGWNVKGGLQMYMEDYDLGVVMGIENGEADVLLVPGSEHVKIKLDSSTVGSVQKMQIVAINLDHTDFVYANQMPDDPDLNDNTED